MRALGLILLLTALPWGCGVHANKPKPSWARGSPNLEHPDYILVVGCCRHKVNAEDARQCAEAEARRQLADAYGVRGGLVRDEYSEYRTEMVQKGRNWQPQKFYSTWILMAHPRKK